MNYEKKENVIFVNFTSTKGTKKLGVGIKSQTDPQMIKAFGKVAFIAAQYGKQYLLAFKLCEEQVVLGRDTLSQILGLSQDELKAISRRHCVLVSQFQRSRGRDIQIVDSSTNGTSVNGKRIKRGEPHRLYPGDTIKIGGLVFKLFENQTAFKKECAYVTYKKEIAYIRNKA